MDFQTQISTKNKTIVALKNDAKQLQSQVDKLIDELREKSDSESFDDEKERILNVNKAMKADQLKSEL